ncbi:MAG: gamma-glutamyl-gamma-aminobutyrate hydrolase family protein [Erysipelotrichaceae bacterium]
MLTIGITCRYNEDFFFIKEAYINYLNRNNCIIIPILPTTNFEYYTTLCDALIISGGLDIDASHYKEVNHTSTNIYPIPIDQYDFDLLEAFNKANKPILGICRGIQVINVYFGGSLYQDIPNHSQTTNKTSTSHSVFVTPNSKLSTYTKVIKVNSFHHQAIKTLAKNFEILAISDDGYIEMIQYNHIVGVQWHPEHLNNNLIFKYFIENCFDC